MKPTANTKFILWFSPSGQISVQQAHSKTVEKHYYNADDIPGIGPHIRDDIRELSAQAVAEKRALLMHLDEPGVGDPTKTYDEGL